MLGEPSQPSGPNKASGGVSAAACSPMAARIWFRDNASAWVTLQADGTLLIRSGVTDLGAGQARQPVPDRLARSSGFRWPTSACYIGDTALTPPAGGTFATRQLYMSGNAILRAARKLRDQLTPVAAKQLGVPRRRSGLATTGWCATEHGDTGLSLSELVRAASEAMVDTSVLHTWRARSGGFDPKKGQGHLYPDYTFGTPRRRGRGGPRDRRGQAPQVRRLPRRRPSDQPDAGSRVRSSAVPRKASATHSARTASPRTATRCHRCSPTTSSRRRWTCRTSSVAFVESGEGRGPLNARGVGEPPIGPPAATIASAVEAAIGIRPTELPITSERVLALLDKRAQQTTEKGRH